MKTFKVHACGNSPHEAMTRAKNNDAAYGESSGICSKTQIIKWMDHQDEAGVDGLMHMSKMTDRRSYQPDDELTVVVESVIAPLNHFEVI